MSTAGLFAVGAVVTIIVGTAMGLLVYGLILERRDEVQRKLAEVRRMPPRGDDRKSAA